MGGTRVMSIVLSLPSSTDRSHQLSVGEVQRNVRRDGEANSSAQGILCCHAVIADEPEVEFTTLSIVGNLG